MGDSWQDAPRAEPESWQNAPPVAAARPDRVGFIGRVTEDLKKRGQQYREIALRANAGEPWNPSGQSTAETALQVTGTTLMSGWDIVGEGAVSLGRLLSDIYPDEPEERIKEEASSLVKLMINIPMTPFPDGPNLGETVEMAAEAYAGFADRSPRAAANLEAVGAIAFTVAPVKAKPKLGSHGTFLDKAARKQAAKSHSKFVEELVMPEALKRVRIDQVSRTEVKRGLFGRVKKVKPSPREAEMVKAVNLVPGIRYRNTLQDNWNVLRDRVAKEAESLVKALKGAKPRIKYDPVTQEWLTPKVLARRNLNEAMANLGKSHKIVGDAATSAERIMMQADDLLRRSPDTSAALLKVRKDLDKWIGAQKPSNIFDPLLENAQTAAVREIRQALNKAVAESVKSVKVQRSLRFQSNLYRAMDNIQYKAANEAAHPLLRTWHKFLRVLPLRGAFNQSLAAVFGLGGLGASAAFAPIFTGSLMIGSGTLGLYRFLASAQAKRLLSTTLKGIDRVMEKAIIMGAAKTDPFILELESDKAAIMELMKLTPEDVE